MQVCRISLVKSRIYLIKKKLPFWQLPTINLQPYNGVMVVELTILFLYLIGGL